MSAVFADTYYFIALLNPGDKEHARSLEFTKTFQGRMVTTAWVLTELADRMCRPPARAIAGLFLEQLPRKREMRVVPAEQPLFAAGLQLFRQRPDKDWGKK
jgi:predicted nucleic acid-binding protein